MFSIPVIKSKLIMPQNPSYFFYSPRIANLCDSIYQRRAVEIAAPPGYGKTSLLIAALKERTRNGRVCWYRMDEQDLNLTVFYAHLVETLFPEEDRKYMICREKFKEFGDVESQTGYINQLICSSLFDCTKRPKQSRNYLVFDDYHTVSDSNEIRTAIRWLIDNLPNSFTIIIAGRTDSELITEKQKLENDTLKIDYHELSLEKEEIEALSNKIVGLKTVDLQRTMDLTEGWVAGILLMLRFGGEGLSKDGKKAELKTAAADTSNFSYFAHELLENIDEELLRFLTGVSILEEFNVEAANCIMKIDHSDLHIKACERKGLFLQITSAEEPVYRFHPLFRNALVKICNERLSSEEINQIHMAAAEYFYTAQNFGKAIEHYLAASRIDLAADMISKASMELTSLEAMGKLRLLFDKIPREALEANPGLMYMKSFLYQNGEEEAKRLLNKALVIFEQVGIADMVLATLFSLLAFHLFRNNASEAEAALKRACDQAALNSGPEYENLIPVFHFVMKVWKGKTQDAEYTLRQLHVEDIPPNYAWTVFMYSCIHYIAAGKFELAQKNVDAAMNMAMVSQADMLKGFALMLQFITAFYNNKPESFEASIKSLMEISERYNVLYMLAFARSYMGLREYRSNHTDQACTLLQTGVDAFERLGNKALSSIFTLYLLLYETGQGNKDEIFERSQKIFSVLSETEPGFFFFELGEMLLGASAVEAGRLETAEKILLHSLNCSEQKDCLPLQSVACMHLANLYYKMEKPNEFERFLRKAFFIASSNGYYVFTGILTKTVVKLAALAAKHQIYSDYAYDLIAANFGKNQANLFMGAINQNDLYGFVEDFLSACSSSGKRSHIIKASFLGVFKLQIDGISIPKNKFVTKKNESILKYLLFYKYKPVSKEHLIELFWPDSDKKSGFASIRTAIYTIRKIFTEYGISDVRDSFIVEKNGCLSIEHPEYIDSDVDHILALDRKRKSITADQERIALLERITDLYGGNLMEEGVYEEWAFFEREELKTMYFNAVSELSMLFINTAQNKKAEKKLLKALSFDPYHEELSTLLIRNYLQQNQRERALSYFNGYKELLERELGMEPALGITKLLAEKPTDL